MKDSSNSRRSGRNRWWTNKRVICVALVLGAALYVFAQPTLEKWTGLDLPDLIDREEPAAQGGPNADAKPGGGFKVDLDALKKKDESTGFQLKETSRETFESPEGLVYAMGPRGEHRIDHVLRHAKNDSSRPVHGVFDAQSQAELLALLDEAYKMVKAKDRNVKSNKDERGTTEHVVDMPSRVGYVGGSNGDRQNNPATKRLELILKGNRVITAYPTWPPRGRR